MDDFSLIRRIDRSDMAARIASLPAQCREGWEQGSGWKIPASWRDSSRFVLLGMGGSAIGGDLVQGFLRDQATRPIFIHRHYTLPRWIDRQTFLLVSSYSGNTEETLFAARQAARQGARIAAITSGGQLSKWASHNGFPLLRIPAGLPPRSAIGYLAFVPLGLLRRLGWIQAKDFPVPEACRSLQEWIRRRLAPSVKLSSNPAKQIARRLAGRLPVLYAAAGGWEGIVYRWRTQFEENAKTLAFHHIFPEATHNEISGWGQPGWLIKRMTALFLTDPAAHPHIQRRMAFVKRIVQREGADALEIRVAGRAVFERMLKMIALGDFASFYLALLYRTDPTPVLRVEALKRYMKKNQRGQTLRGQTP